jgi:hypothetical protein
MKPPTVKATRGPALLFKSAIQAAPGYCKEVRSRLTRVNLPSTGRNATCISKVETENGFAYYCHSGN